MTKSLVSSWSLISICLFTSPSFGLDSSHLKQFRITQCLAQSCFQAEGPLAFMSMNQDSMFAQDVKLEVKQGQNEIVIQQGCAEFRFHFHSQALTCDNRELSGTPTLMIDSKFNISKILSNRKNKS